MIKILGVIVVAGLVGLYVMWTDPNHMPTEDSLQELSTEEGAQDLHPEDLPPSAAQQDKKFRRDDITLESHGDVVTHPEFTDTDDRTPSGYAYRPGSSTSLGDRLPASQDGLRARPEDPSFASPPGSTLPSLQKGSQGRQPSRSSRLRRPPRSPSKTKKTSSTTSRKPQSIQARIAAQPYNQPLYNPFPGSNIKSITKIPPKQTSRSPSSTTGSSSSFGSSSTSTTSRQPASESTQIPPHCMPTDANPIPAPTEDCPRLRFEIEQPPTSPATQSTSSQTSLQDVAQAPYDECLARTTRLMIGSTNDIQSIPNNIEAFCRGITFYGSQTP